jgi:hypothetical protein
MLSSSLTHGSREFEAREAAEEAAEAFAKNSLGAAELSAVYRRSVRRLGRYTQGAPGVSAAWHEAPR